MRFSVGRVRITEINRQYPLHSVPQRRNINWCQQASTS